MHHCFFHLLCRNSCSKHRVRERAEIERSHEDDGPKQCCSLDCMVYYKHVSDDCHCHVNDYYSQGNFSLFEIL